jgi:hypothetical protein
MPDSFKHFFAFINDLDYVRFNGRNRSQIIQFIWGCIHLLACIPILGMSPSPRIYANSTRIALKTLLVLFIVISAVSGILLFISIGYSKTCSTNDVIFRNKFGQWEIPEKSEDAELDENILIDEEEDPKSIESSKNSIIRPTLRQRIGLYDSLWQVLFAVSFIITHGLFMILRVHGGHCLRNGDRPYYCNPNQCIHTLPSDTLILLGFSPLLAMLILTRYQIQLVVVIFTIILIVLFCSTGISSTHEGSSAYEIWQIILILVLPSIIIYETKRRNDIKFVMSQSLKY